MPTTSYTDSTFSVNAIGGRTDSTGADVPDYTAEEARFVAQILEAGYLKPINSFKVQPQASPNMTVKVGSGTAKSDYYVIAGSVAGQGNYVVRLDSSSLNVTVPAADASQPRTDEVYLVVRDDTYDASARGLPQIGYRKGDLGGAAPGPDAAWDAAVLLASIDVPAAETSIQTAAITDERILAQLLPGLASSDHGALTGLVDDDHPQYHNDTRGDLRYITKSLVDAKGDLVAATAADALARLPVGTNGQVLTADSTQSTGLAWKDASPVSAVDYLTANETVTNSTTLVASGLSLPVEANAIYLVEAALFYDAPTAADIKFGRTYPTGTTGVLAVVGMDLADSVSPGDTAYLAVTDLTIPGSLGGIGSTTAFPIVSRLEGRIITAGSSGVFTVTFAQNVTNASPTTLCAGSWLRLTRVA